MYSESSQKVEVPNLGSLTEIRLGVEHRGSRVLTHVLKYSSGTRVSVTSPKTMWGRLHPMTRGLTEQYTSRLEPIIDKLWSTLMTGYSSEHGTRTTSTSACVELGLQESQPVPISVSMTIEDLGTFQSTVLTQWLMNSVRKGQKTSPLSNPVVRSVK